MVAAAGDVGATGVVPGDEQNFEVVGEGSGASGDVEHWDGLHAEARNVAVVVETDVSLEFGEVEIVGEEACSITVSPGVVEGDGGAVSSASGRKQ